MPEPIAVETIIGALEIYGWIGLAVAAVFLAIGVDRVDESARGSYFFRIAVFPGVVALWPIVLIRWAQLELRRRAQ